MYIYIGTYMCIYIYIGPPGGIGIGSALLEWIGGVMRGRYVLPDYDAAVIVTRVKGLTRVWGGRWNWGWAASEGSAYVYR